MTTANKNLTQQVIYYACVAFVVGVFLYIPAHVASGMTGDPIIPTNQEVHTHE